MILKLGMEHLGLKFSKVYINDNACLTVNYFMPRSFCSPMHLNGGKLLHMQSFIAANNQIDRTFMFLKNMDPRGGLPLPCSYIDVYDHFFIHLLLKNRLSNENQISLGKGD